MVHIFAPRLYAVLKFNINDIIRSDFVMDIPAGERFKYIIKQQDNPLFRQVRLITGNTEYFNPYVVFVNIRGGAESKAAIRTIVEDGIYINGKHFILSERSASMTRTAIISLVDEEISEELNRRITMDITFDKIVLSKYFSYRGLSFSSCHMMEGWMPKIIIVPDYYRTIHDQNIKYAADVQTEFIDREGNRRTWTQKEIKQDIRDIEINAFDGCGLHHPSISAQAEAMLGSKTRMTSILWRGMPFIKGVTHEVNYTEFYQAAGIEYIQDIWGKWHDVRDEMIIMTESMYKGKKYIETYKDSRDWDLYWERFQKYQHCIGISKWNFSVDEEPVYTRANYQVLQDLDLTYEDFNKLADYSKKWANSIINGNIIYTYCFLGMMADNHNSKNDYVRAILKNPEMIKEDSIRKYISHLLNKYCDDMKCGKLWLKATFKFLVPDLIMMMECFGGLEPRGCLKSDEFYSHNKEGDYIGEYLIERNPHICKSEHVLLAGTTNEMIEKYCSHLDNICMINCKSITPQRLNGADFDGDLVLLVDDEIMKAGVDRNAPVVIDIEDKITALAEEDTVENRLALIYRTINSLIGETSNCATGYHNKKPRSKETAAKYESYVDLLSIINGKAVDYAKTGVLYNIPKHIAKYSKPLPYFMKYASEYYRGLNKFSNSQSNMNRLCKDIEKWRKTYRYNVGNNFDYSIMMKPDVEIDEEIYAEIEQIYLEFCKEMRELTRDQSIIRKYGDDSISKFDSKNFTISWDYYYEKYKSRVKKIVSDQSVLANIAVDLCYRKYPTKNKRFLWVVAGKGVLNNIEQIDFKLPMRDEDGEYEYLGRKYKLVDSIDTEVIAYN